MTPERWLVLTVHVESSDLRDLVAAELIELGGASVVEDGSGISTYLAPDGDAAEVIGEAGSRLTAALPADATYRLEWRWQQDEDWAKEWKRGLQPREVTGRIVVKPTWTEWEARPGQIVIDIDPQMAFGTGEHATTRGCLRLLDRTLRPGDRVLDVGSGSAILAIAAAMLGASEVVAVEYDPDANLNARENLEANGVVDRVTIIEAMADDALLAELGTFQLITANILSSVIRPLLPAFYRALSPAEAGILIVSGILQTERDQVVQDAAAAGFSLADEDAEEDWWSGVLIPAP